MEDIELFKIGGLAGVVTFFFYLIVKLILKHPSFSQLPPRSQMSILLIILFMAFGISSYGLYIFLQTSITNDGGKQPESSIMMGKKPFRLASYASFSPPDCQRIKTGEFEIWLSFNEEKPYYILHEETSQLRVVFKGIDGADATFEIWKSNAILSGPTTLKPGQDLQFRWNDCDCKLTYKYQNHRNAGVKYLNKTRNTALYSLSLIPH